jgi:hypothetical protein
MPISGELLALIFHVALCFTPAAWSDEQLVSGKMWHRENQTCQVPGAVNPCDDEV